MSCHNRRRFLTGFKHEAYIGAQTRSVYTYPLTASSTCKCQRVNQLPCTMRIWGSASSSAPSPQVDHFAPPNDVSVYVGRLPTHSVRHAAGRPADDRPGTVHASLQRPRTRQCGPSRAEIPTPHGPSSGGPPQALLQPIVCRGLPRVGADGWTMAEQSETPTRRRAQWCNYRGSPSKFITGRRSVAMRAREGRLQSACDSTGHSIPHSTRSEASFQTIP